jgi:hypothetical protein
MRTYVKDDLFEGSILRGMEHTEHSDSGSIVALESCLLRLENEIAVLDRLGDSLAALRVAEACDAIRIGLEKRRERLPASDR